MADDEFVMSNLLRLRAQAKKWLEESEEVDQEYVEVIQAIAEEKKEARVSLLDYPYDFRPDDENEGVWVAAEVFVPNAEHDKNRYQQQEERRQQQLRDKAEEDRKLRLLEAVLNSFRCDQ